MENLWLTSETGPTDRLWSPLQLMLDGAFPQISIPLPVLKKYNPRHACNKEVFLQHIDIAKPGYIVWLFVLLVSGKAIIADTAITNFFAEYDFR